MTATPEVTRLAWLWLAGALALVVMPHLLRLPPWLGLLCIATIGWRLLRDLRGWALPGPWLRFFFTLGGMGAVFASYGTLFGPEPGVALLTVMLTMKLMEMRGLRDATVVILLAYFLVATGFLFNQSIANGIYLFLAVAVLTATLVVLNHPAAESRLAGQYLRRAADLLLQAVPLMIILFVLFPRVSGSIWGISVQSSGTRTGLSDTMSIGDVSQLAESSEVAFRVEFVGTPPAHDRLYWRGPVLWYTDGRRWEGLPPELTRRLPPAKLDLMGMPVDYTVTLEPHGKHWLFLLELPATLPGEAASTLDGQVLAQRPVDQLRRYQARSYPDARDIGLPRGLRSLALNLPQGMHSQARALAREWLAEGLDESELVQRALAWFREQPFFYSHEPPPLGADPVDEFLFRTRTGFCEHYAASFVVLMRSAGVPARVVTGYMGGEFNPLGGHYVVRQSDAHAWAEVYLSGQGWVRVDPTRAIPPQRVASGTRRVEASTGEQAGSENTWLGSVLRGARQLLDAADHGWNQWVLGYGADKQQRLLERLGLPTSGWHGLVALLAAAAITVVAGVAAWLVWQRRRTADPLVHSFDRVLARLARHGLMKQPHEGPLAFAARVRAASAELGARFEDLARRYTELRYGPVPGREAVRQFRRAARRFRI